MAKVQDVELYNTVLERSESFEINHAERILRMPKNGGWQLPEDSQYKFDFNNGIGYRSNKKAVIGTEKAGDNSESDSASE